MPQCKCGSYAINHHHHGRDGDDGHLCDVCYWRTRAELLRAERDAMVIALRRAKRLCEEALPKFNWGASALDANAIALLNDVPREVTAALAQIEQERSEQAKEG